MTELLRRIAFLRDCHEADNRELALWNLLGGKSTLAHGHEGRDEVLDGSLDRWIVPKDWAEQASAAIAAYKRERILVTAVFPIVGKADIGGQRRKLCAPLLLIPTSLHEAKLGEDLVHFAVPDFESMSLNASALVALVRDDASPDALDELAATLPEQPWDAAKLFDLEQRLAELIPSVDWSPLRSLPELTSLDEVRESQRRAATRPTCLPALITIHVEKPRQTRGLLFELRQLVKERQLSSALSALLEPGPQQAVDAGDFVPEVPAVLSRAQIKVLAAGARQHLSLAVGPPGTGKSFTVAALALDHLRRGESVLFAARSETAVDVLAEKLESLLGDSGLIVRAGRKGQLTRCADRLQRLMHGVLPFPEVEGLDLPALEDKLGEIDRSLRNYERAIKEQAALELRAGRTLVQPLSSSRVGGLLNNVRRAWVDWRLSRHHPQWDYFAAHSELLTQKEQTLSHLLKLHVRENLERALISRRKNLRSFMAALRARTSARQDDLMRRSEFTDLVATFPLWLSDLGALHRVVPLQSELFDLVIIDEATQCDAASALPALQRAKRAVVTGDPRQLRHVSFLSNARQEQLAERHGLSAEEGLRFDYRSRSLLDLVEDAATGRDQVTFLDEHFRSRAQIIEFSNREFYGGALKVMTRNPRDDRQGHVELQHVGGRREPCGRNEAEAEAVRETILRIRSSHPEGATQQPSIGVLSPFRKQVERLRQKLSQELPPGTWEQNDLLVDTPYGFQGHERDIMLISLVLDPSSHSTSLRYLDRDDVFNVAVTRARDRQVLFCSLEAADLPRGSLLRRYLESAEESLGTPDCGGIGTDEPVLTGVVEGLQALGFETWTEYGLAGMVVDVLALKKGHSIGIDIIGETGRMEEAWSVERHGLLRRAGLEVMPLQASLWRRAQAACLKAIQQRWALTHPAQPDHAKEPSRT